MKKIFILLTAVFVPFSLAAQEIGKPAPDFTLTDSNGKTHKLSDQRGKYVVLEWINPGCPYVKKHYNSKNMQNLQEKYTGQGVVWYTINSSAPGKQGHLDSEAANKEIKEKGAHMTALLLDHDGKVGKAYNAKVTPHMFVIDKEGKLLYNGAIDDNNSADPEDIKSSKNHVAEALDKAMKGEPVEIASTDPYGCTIKYAG